MPILPQNETRPTAAIKQNDDEGKSRQPRRGERRPSRILGFSSGVRTDVAMLPPGTIRGRAATDTIQTEARVYGANGPGDKE